MCQMGAPDSEAGIKTPAGPKWNFQKLRARRRKIFAAHYNH